MTSPTTPWATKPLGDLVDILDSKRAPISAKERAGRVGPVPYYGAAGQVGTIDHPIFNEPLLLLGEDGIQFFDPSKTKAYLIDGPSWVNNHAHVLRAGPTIERRFLNYYLNHCDYHRFANGTTRLKLTQAAMRLIPIPVPPLNEQRRIVDLLEDHLSRLDAAGEGLMNARRRTISLERSALDVYFGADASVPLDQFIDDISAGKSFGSSSGPAKDDEWGIIKVSAMTRGEFNPDENKAVPVGRVDPRFEIREGDLLVSRANTADYVGASVLVGPVRPRLLLSDKSMRITLKNGARSDWLWRALQAPSARRQISALATGTKDSMRNISQSSLRQILLPKASTADQGRALAAFAEVKESSNRLRREVESQQDRLIGLRRSLLAAAFTGRLTGQSGDLDRAEEMAGA